MSDLENAKAAFQESLERYPGNDDSLVISCIGKLERYTDPAEKRDQDIQRRAAAAIAAVQSIGKVRSRLSDKVSTLLVAVNVHAGSVTIDAMSTISSLKPMRVEEISELGGRMLWARQVAFQSIMAAAAVPDLGRETLREFSSGFSTRASSYLEAIIKVTQDDQRDKLIDALVASFVPGAAMLVTAARWVGSVHDKAKEMAHSYRGYGAEDRLFAFARRLEEEALLCESIGRTIDASTDAIATASSGN